MTRTLITLTAFAALAVSLTACVSSSIGQPDPPPAATARPMTDVQEARALAYRDSLGARIPRMAWDSTPTPYAEVVWAVGAVTLTDATKARLATELPDTASAEALLLCDGLVKVIRKDTGVKDVEVLVTDEQGVPLSALDRGSGRCISVR